MIGSPKYMQRIFWRDVTKNNIGHTVIYNISLCEWQVICYPLGSYWAVCYKGLTWIGLD